MKYNKSLIILMIFAVIACISMAGSVSASDTSTTTQTINVAKDTTAPTVTANPAGGSINSSKTVTLTPSENATIYYTLNGTIPTTKSTQYTRPITISKTTTLKYIAVDTAGNKSPVYTTKYTIDKTTPKISSFYPKSSVAGVSRTNTLYVKFSENIKAGANWSKIYVKNLKTGKKVAVSKSISSNILYLKTGTRTSYTWYQIYIPYAAVKDVAGNNLAKSYAWKFKTGTAATTVLDKGSKTIYGKYTVSHNDARIYSSTPKSVCSWTTYKYSSYNVKMVFTKDRYKYYEGKFVYAGTSKYTVYITKASSSTVKVVQYKWYSETGKTTTYTGYWKINGGNAVNFYKSSTFKTNYLNIYLKY